MRKLGLIVLAFVLLCLGALYLWAQGQGVLRAGQPLLATARGSDPEATGDGGQTLTAQFVWLINDVEVLNQEAVPGQLQTEGEYTGKWIFEHRLAAGITKAGDEVVVQVRSEDGTGYGAWYETARIEIHGWLPVIEAVEVTRDTSVSVTGR